jgi:hypothetical protein
MTQNDVSEQLSDEQLNNLINSDVFYKKARDPIGRKILFENQLHEQNVIEHKCSPDDLARILRHIEQVWTKYGATDPHWSVVSIAKFRANVISQNLQAFYDSGCSEVENMKRILRRTGST